MIHNQGGIISINFNDVKTWMGIIFIFTLLNTFFNSLCVAYGLPFPYSTFLANSSDLHADLIKTAVSLLHQYNIPNIHEWSPLYQDYFFHYPYGGFNVDVLEKNSFTLFHMPPLSVNLTIVLSKVILVTSADTLVFFFYMTVIILLFYLSTLFANNKKEVIFLSLTMLLSYPILLMLTRGYIYSLIIGILSIVLLFNVNKSNSSWLISIVLLSLIINLRPNAVILLALLFSYGFREGLKYSIFAIILSGLLFFSNLGIVQNIYPQYTLEHFSQGLKVYYQLYIIGHFGDSFNNSLYGLEKYFFTTISYLMVLSPQRYAKTLEFNTILGLGITLFSIILFNRRKIDLYGFSFLIVLIYSLAFTIFSVYYLLIFFAFLLIPLKDNELQNSYFYKEVVILSSITLIPKNYIFNDALSLESVVNPILMLSVAILIIRKSLKNRRVGEEL